MSGRARTSIVINNYNYGRFVGEAIESALAQTDRRTEVIVVDDGSTDNSRAVIQAFGGRIEPVFKANGGQASAFNAGVERSAGDIVIFLDADDRLEPQAVARCRKLFADPRTAKAHWPLSRIDASGERTGSTTPEGSLLEGDLSELIRKHGPATYGTPPHSAPTSGNAWARWFLEKVLPIPEAGFRWAADAYLLDLAPVYGLVSASREPLGSYRVHGGNDTLKPLQQYAEESVSRYELLCQALSDHLRRLGWAVGPGEWARDTWHHKILRLIQDVNSVAPVDATLVLIDGDQLNSGPRFASRPRFHLVDRDGQSWGHPVDDASAIQELEALRARGADLLVVAWTAFWYFDHYSGFAEYVRGNFRRILHTAVAEIFQIAEPGQQTGPVVGALTRS